MNARQHTVGLAVVSLTLFLAACGGGTVDPPLVGTLVTSTADSGTGSLRNLLSSAKDGDTLKLASGTVTLASPLKVTRSVTLDLGSGVIDAAGKGRALEILSGVTVTIKGGTLKGGEGQPITASGIPGALSSQALTKATYGGLLINQGALRLEGTTLSGGTAMNGGAVFNDSSASLTLKDAVFINNKAIIPTPDLPDESTGSGGAIINNGTLQIDFATFKNNTAYYTGGAIRTTPGNGAGGSITITDGLFEANSTTAPLSADGSSGGVLMVGTNAIATINGGTFRDNTSTASGGVIFNLSRLTINGGTFIHNSSKDGGVINNYIGGTLKLTGGLLEGNAATGYGGAVFLNRQDVSFEMTGGTLRGNTAALNGGAINGDGVMSMTGGVIESNTAQGNGGGIQVYAQVGQKSNFTLGGTAVIRANNARYGGGINVGSADPSGATLDMQGGTVTGNSAVSGGGIFADVKSVFKAAGGSVTGNTPDNVFTAK